MRKCLKCGELLPDVAMKCDKCGSEELSLIEEESANTKKLKPVILITAVIAVAVIVAIAFTYSHFKTSAYTKPVKNAVVAVTSGDLDAYLKEIPEKMQGDTENYYFEKYGSTEAFKNGVESSLEEEFGENFSVDAKVIDSYDFSDDLLESLNASCKENGYNIEFQNAKHITLRLMIESQNGNTKNYTAVTEISVESDGKWYYLPNELFESEQQEQTTSSQQ